MKKVFGLIIGLLILTGAAVGDQGWYQNNGYLHAANFTYSSDGYWYYNGQSYTRQYVAPTYNSSTCCYSQGYWYYVPYKITQNIDYKDPNYLDKFAEILLYKSKAETRIREDAFKKQNFLELAQALNLNNVPVNGQTPLNSYTSSYGYTQNYIPTGNTIYQVQHATQLYGDLDPNQFMQASYRLNEALIKSASQGNTEFGTIVNQALDYHAKMADVIAKNEAWKSYLASLNQYKTQTSVTQVTPQPQLQYMPQADSGRNQVFAQLKQDCISCHDQKTTKGGFQVDSFLSMDQASKFRVISRLLMPSSDAKAMPRTNDGKHAPLPQDKISAWISMVK